MKKWICFCLKKEKRVWEVLLAAFAVGFFCYGALASFGTSWQNEFKIQFAKVAPAAGKSVKVFDRSGSSPEASAKGNGSVQKLSYERMKSGDIMYSGYFGLLNIRSAPSKRGELLGQIAYGDEVQAYWKEDSGYVRVLFKKAHSDELIEGYCTRKELSDTEPKDARIYLGVADFKQYDGRWANVSLGGSYETIATAGCTTTCLAMAYSYLEGHVTTPDMMEERLFYNDDGLLSFPKAYVKISEKDYLSAALEKLQQKIPVLIGCKRDDGSPHWVLIMGYSGDGVNLNTEDFLIHDPASEERHTLADFFAEFPNFNKIAYYNGT
ncbi:SH3 domain-containing protein [Qiania dongpingensis]|uniref:SH3 domain-containing protein n=1 Tax=Qiania dongpingensis TaxID=2763669 RepID=A0A7G9G4V0_9FIRM|nr:SH3 domain-containing protein [Qiania dongpingensis]QNM05832.1 SH3 domain-containing protein [Qiania dongpingensis]